MLDCEEKSDPLHNGGDWLVFSSAEKWEVELLCLTRSQQPTGKQAGRQEVAGGPVALPHTVTELIFSPSLRFIFY